MEHHDAPPASGAKSLSITMFLVRPQRIFLMSLTRHEVRGPPARPFEIDPLQIRRDRILLDAARPERQVYDPLDPAEKLTADEKIAMGESEQRIIQSELFPDD